MSAAKHIPDMPVSVYNADPGVRSTLLKNIDKGRPPAVAGHSSPPTENMLFGTLVHETWLDRRTQGRFAIVEDGRTKAGKAARGFKFSSAMLEAPPRGVKGAGCQMTEVKFERRIQESPSLVAGPLDD